MLDIKNKFLSEKELVTEMLEKSKFLGEKSINNNASEIIQLCRKNKSDRTMLDAFLNEYGLDNQEGVALMCLAESVLRIPDKKTRDLIISEKLSAGSWIDHLNKADSIFVNASTLGLLLAGKVVNTPSEWSDDPYNFLSGLISKSGEMPIRNAVLAAMQILSQEFVIGKDFRDIEKLSNLENESYSFDMLGEAARTVRQADNYFNAYMNAIDEVGKLNLIKNLNNGVSIKISALHPRYEMRKFKDLESELIPRLIELVHYAHSKDVEITIDAEEQDRLTLSLNIIEKLAFDKIIKNWTGFGIALQAYSKRSINVIHWFNKILDKREKMHLRLVKGAYWDYEIKHAQVSGYEDYPVYSKKSLTDISFLLCAKEILKNEKIYAKFATHNAHTISSVHQLGRGKDYEFQRLYGMGELLYQSAEEVLNLEKKPSVYAPIGSYKDLLPYLVRRLLENGANSSFINRLLDPETDANWLAENPAIRIEKEKINIPLPKNIFTERKNSLGFDLSENSNLENLEKNISAHKKNKINAESIYVNRDEKEKVRQKVYSIANNEEIGTAIFDDPTNVKSALENFASEKWSKYSVQERSQILIKISDDIEKDPSELIFYLLNEAGKTIQNAIDEIREAIDFLRYYSRQIIEIHGKKSLQGPTGEINKISYSPKGNYLCISPWNFPVAILIGQISAALACGNNVVVKPSENTSILGYLIVKKFHENGVPIETLQLILGDGMYGDVLTKINTIHGVAFTGSLPTAKKIQTNLIQHHKEIVPLIAETGGINAMIVDSSALLEQVTDDVVRSAFDSAGQRCSALRVLCIQEEIYDELIEMIKGNMEIQEIGDPNNFSTDIGPIINKHALQKLNDYIKGCKDRGMEVHNCNNSLKETHMSPTIIEINNISAIQEEQFGPILHVMRYKFDDMNSLISQINESGYGLTMGIHTRIESRADFIGEKSNVGNIYINRDMVGAVVGSQPFGGIGLSGSGFKAGGPNYLLQFLNEKVISKNSVAFGGNTELLNLQEDL
ncbi:bifunctional proline dehydrogenase/L-glutamate gamma-semialdehyde dehydrogenase PutA [Gammaproteobacteria bacterium]|nr:bifunctional proline dehydrogenase/L-glutamate gamma-semialdehyde dehydrogenase PutA [Gammaproteobacteria bacterium]